MTGSALRNDGARGKRVRRAFALAAALWLAAPGAHADDAMIVIPGRGETVETALAHASAAGVAGVGQPGRGGAGVATVAGSGGAVPVGNAGAGMVGAGTVAPAAQPAGTMVVVDVPAPAAVPSVAPRAAYADARANSVSSAYAAHAATASNYAASRYAAPRAADPGAVATVVAGAPEPASTAPRPAFAARAAAVRTAYAAPAPQPAAAAQPATPPGQQDPESIRRSALAFLQQQIAGLPGKTTTTVAAAFPRGLAECTTLEPFLPTGARLWGRTTVGVRCAGARPWTVYLQAKVTVQATYYVAARQIAPGEPLTAADLIARNGDLTVLPLAVITDPAQAIGATSLARIAAGLPLRQDMLKSAASVSAGQTVRVVAAGPGFTISAEGNALANAAPGQSVRVRMAAGQIVTAIVKDAGTVEIPL
ncbi:flagellar basal body P-ring formation chaperone FlgA [Burkholderia vietnamiensis]|jgi:flagella basal body P-ring formation protein FlgA|uniref:flagellar basal body P-ring formation chaperone FlgA n=1 Tax=Burkholderia vietnamiensis TaxID=60552 RepID=UPI000757CBD0|nr:flagellar basal body P-ring formation chaperone FlgA [Burkholderia vietnamiensis]KVF40556.1 flagellar biosynthesis protein FlgA [Burkholderia vietnamiensis]MBR8284098.1 flagellar basal body P-ring formation protein FlgA [Burkholderia vietnamiensis]MCA8196939.1 flagellar basal body P-ring formation protein FlgA [Burkholderia vietnamiensis]WHU93012.1 flagellar basal body P-ring formation chaperone FlgA [Burkholderia vietnamiensis]HDR9028524.1 flagellar basal body P-ring formation protein FlgA